LPRFSHSHQFVGGCALWDPQTNQKQKLFRPTGKPTGKPQPPKGSQRYSSQESDKKHTINNTAQAKPKKKKKKRKRKDKSVFLLF